ncbi:MAG: hypothetical protein JKY34_01275 [Kordiimonadaceae bacterium]|nr:hypothetical protein [Kordiimonadaceae bacterium]
MSRIKHVYYVHRSTGEAIKLPVAEYLVFCGDCRWSGGVHGMARSCKGCGSFFVHEPVEEYDWMPDYRYELHVALTVFKKALGQAFKIDALLKALNEGLLKIFPKTGK